MSNNTQLLRFLGLMELAVRRTANSYPEFIDPQPISQRPIFCEESLEHELLIKFADQIAALIKEHQT